MRSIKQRPGTRVFDVVHEGSTIESICVKRIPASARGGRGVKVTTIFDCHHDNPDFEILGGWNCFRTLKAYLNYFNVRVALRAVGRTS